MFKDTDKLLFALGVVPVIRLERAEEAVLLCRALARGGLPVAEITFRTAAAAEAISRVRAELPEVLVGAGTVTSVALAERALESGASFIVTPGFSPEVVKWCLQRRLPVYPGCTTASEVEAAMHLGLETVKFFPAEQSGGLAKIRALLGPYPGMKFMPTGGISAANLASYLSCPQIVACGGSFMVPEAKIASGDWAGIQRLAGEAAAAAQGFELRRAGPCLAGEARDEAAGVFSRLLGVAPQPAGEPGVGGELAIGPVLLGASGQGAGCGQAGFQLVFEALNLERSLVYLTLWGLDIAPESREYGADGRLLALDLKKAVAGCRVRLVQK